MSKKVLFSLLLVPLGAFLVVTGAGKSKDDPIRSYSPASGEVVDHRVSINWDRWKNYEPHAMEVQTQVKIRDEKVGLHGPVILRDYFSRGENAWDFAAAEPPVFAIHGSLLRGSRQ